jgi:sensor histidine kinase YesM
VCGKQGVKMKRRKARIFRESFQLKIVRNLIFAGFFSLVILALLGYMILFWSSTAQEMGLRHSGSPLFLNLAKVFLIVSVLLFGLILWVSFLISRNLFGPLVRLRNHMEELNKGEKLDSIRFRRSDELVFHYLSEQFNQLTYKVVNLKKEVKDIEREISDFIDRNKTAIVTKESFIPFVQELKEKVLSITKNN